MSYYTPFVYWNPSNNQQTLSRIVRQSSPQQSPIIIDIYDPFTLHEKKEMSGEQFNKLFSDTKFVKLTNDLENHNGFQFEDGLNIDTIKFNPSGSCSAGGIYFTTYQKAYLWFSYGRNVMKYIRNVTIPDDARVYIEENKFKVDKIFLGPKNIIGQDIIKQVIELNYVHLQYVKEQTDDICILAVKRDGSALKYVHKQTEDICKLAVQGNGFMLKYVKEQTNDICTIAVRQYCHALEFVKLQTPELCKLAIQGNGSALQYVKEQTEELCNMAIQQNGLALKYVTNQNEELCILAVQRDVRALKYVKEQTDKICKLAVQKDGNALKYVKKQTKEICDLAVQESNYALEYVEEQFKSKIFEF